MDRLVVIPPGGGELIGDAPDRRVEILDDGDALHATWSRFAPRRNGADLHVHDHHMDVFYVLEGELTLRLGPQGRELAAPAGTLARIPPGVVHGFRNAADRELRYLNLHVPGMGFAAYMRGLRDGRPVDFDQHEPPADGGRAVDDVVIGAPDGGAVDGLTIAEVTGAAGDVADAWLYVLEGALDVSGDRAPAGSWVRLPGRERAVAVRPAAGVPAARALEIRVRTR